MKFGKEEHAVDAVLCAKCPLFGEGVWVWELRNLGKGLNKMKKWQNR